MASVQLAGTGASPGPRVSAVSTRVSIGIPAAKTAYAQTITVTARSPAVLLALTAAGTCARAAGRSRASHRSSGPRASRTRTTMARATTVSSVNAAGLAEGARSV